MDKKILVIDDEDQKDDIRDLEIKARQKGVNLTCEQFNVGSPNEPELLSDGYIDIGKVKLAYKERFRDKGIEFNMIVCDWNLSDKLIDGAELLREMGTECFSVKMPRILYSGLLYEKIEEQLNKYEKNKDDNATREIVVKYLASLVNSNYLAFVERGESMKKTVMDHLQDSEDLDFLILDTLDRYPDKIIETGHGHNFEGIKFSEVASEFRNNKDVKYDFKRNLIQEVLQYLTERHSKKK